MTMPKKTGRDVVHVVVEGHTHIPHVFTDAEEARAFALSMYPVGPVFYDISIDSSTKQARRPHVGDTVWFAIADRDAYGEVVAVSDDGRHVWVRHPHAPEVQIMMRDNVKIVTRRPLGLS